MNSRLNNLLEHYSESHQNPINKAIHWVCVPTIFVSIVALLYHTSPALAYCLSLLVVGYYLRLSLSLGLGMGVFMLFIFSWLHAFATSYVAWLLLFALAWVGQFVGHLIEGKKPSFFEDLQFLLIGPLWVINSLSHKFGAKFFKTPSKQSAT